MSKRYFDAVDIQKCSDVVLVSSAMLGITTVLADYVPDSHLSNVGVFISALSLIGAVVALSIRTSENVQIKSEEPELERVGGTS